jgi:uncharacterized membrane protein YccF (DUF307 family)
MNLIGNIIWLVFGGFFAALGYLFGGIALCITIVGIPWGMQCFKLVPVVLFPFGAQVVNKSSYGGCVNTFANIIWIICGGLYTAFVHLVFAFLFAVTIIGLPFAKQHLKLLEISLMPFGKKVVYK